MGCEGGGGVGGNNLKYLGYFQTKHACDLQSLNHTHNNYVGVVMGGPRSTTSI